MSTSVTREVVGEESLWFDAARLVTVESADKPLRAMFATDKLAMLRELARNASWGFSSRETLLREAASIFCDGKALIACLFSDWRKRFANTQQSRLAVADLFRRDSHLLIHSRVRSPLEFLGLHEEYHSRIMLRTIHSIAGHARRLVTKLR